MWLMSLLLTRIQLNAFKMVSIVFAELVTTALQRNIILYVSCCCFYCTKMNEHNNNNKITKNIEEYIFNFFPV